MIQPSRNSAFPKQGANSRENHKERFDMKTITRMLLAFALIFSCTTCLAGAASVETGTTIVSLNGNSITMNGTGAAIEGNVITITSAGTYSIRGTLKDGQIRVDTQDADSVKLILNGMDISSSSSAPLYVVNAEKTIITLADGTKNYVTDGNSYVAEITSSDEPNAAIFSKDDLTINGGGSLVVDANYNDGITSKDDLKINGGTITVNAVNDGVRGRDSVVVKGGTTTIKADGDGIQANNDDDSTKGYVSIEDGTISIIAGADGIQAETSLTISGGSITVSSGGSSANSVNPASNQNPGGIPGMDNNADTNDSSSGKGLKAGVALTITGGSITVDSADDSIHSNGSITINGGIINVASGDDGIHSDTSIDITGGDIRITKSYEGIESSIITINNGSIHLVASDDGINGASDSDTTSTNVPPGQMGFESAGNNALMVNGGYIVVNAGGDGLDINGPITMTGGVVIVNGPTDNGNGAIDYTGSFKITGGNLVAAGSSGMAQAPGNSSTQYSVMLTFPSAQSAGTMVHVETKAGKDILTVVPTKTFQSVVFSTPELQSGSEYVTYSGGSSTGTVTDGLYSGGTYKPGTQVFAFNISGPVTTAGSQSGGNPGPNPGNRPTPGNQTNMPTPMVTTTVPTTTVPTGQYEQVYFTTTPEGAVIIIDGVQKTVVTPVYIPVTVGTHQVIFTSPGYNQLRTTFVVAKSMRNTISANLVHGTDNKIPVPIVVTTIPTTAPTTVPTTVPTTKVTTAVPTTVPTTRVTTTVPTTTVPTGQYEQVYFTTTPLGAVIIIDGVQKTVVTPVYVPVTVGTHQVIFTSPGYNQLRTTFVVAKNMRNTISGNLVHGTDNKIPAPIVVTTIPTTAPTTVPATVPITGNSGAFQLPSWAKQFITGSQFSWA